MNEYLQRCCLLNNSRNPNENEEQFLNLAALVTGPRSRFVIADPMLASPTTLKQEAKSTKYLTVEFASPNPSTRPRFY